MFYKSTHKKIRQHLIIFHEKELKIMRTGPNIFQVKVAEFGGIWRSLAYLESLFWLRLGSNFALLYIKWCERVL